ncbi:MAG: hypothetical protein NC038_03060 [Paludibacter sp.]|nr:hypothetical protein [Bacteroidales bacterium]MCM1069150.1 hypothetical protein [Prevotella sp.]MCM1353589.1 hypothetical protein [Bacteroides sp.]MCM1442750.1 hypothetical protein [Muribaculum sp.]MCM1481614.1 hypothetical protein [Paludibacter sp.]
MKYTGISFVLVASLLAACTSGIKSSQVLITSEAGQNCAKGEAVVFTKKKAADAVVVDLQDKRQTVDGFGGSLTESSAFVLACLKPAQRKAILKELYGKSGADFSVARTQIGASDFSVEGHYSLAEQEGDIALESFSLDRDKEGFPAERYPQVKDNSYDLFYLIKEVLDIKQNQTDNTLRIMASPWTAPAWMKDNKRYYQRNEEGWRGGKLLPEYYPVFADYFVKYLQAWRAEGLEFWAITPENEPMGNDGGWESMEVSPAEEALFIGKYLGPALAANGFGDVKIFGFDQNTFEMGPYTAAVYGDEQASAYTTGMAVHWYGSTISCFPEVLDSVHNLYPDKTIFHSEGCIDNLGCAPWDGVSDPIGFVESGWFANDAFWWNQEATDWGYSTPFWPEWHPKYAPVHRYAQYIIDGMNHWLTGYCDWNIVLDSIGGPNHVGNFAGAQVMVDYQNDIVYFTPYYYVLKQFSRSMRPGDVVLGVTESVVDNLHVCAVQKADGTYAVNMLNKSIEPIRFNLQMGDYCAEVDMPANALQTIFVALP